MDGIEADVGEAALVVRVELPSPEGKTIGARYGVTLTPTFLIFDAQGELVRRSNWIDRTAAVGELLRLAGR